ncbi:hypothetical protein FRC17_002753 [Serendipita sp. 399]|nr:hypothetical protein FRC17_002753 [Serendipita sp. 399]
MDLRLSIELEHECRALLSDLDELGHRGPLSIALQDRYNQIIDDHWKSLLPDPLTVLPPEICNQIITEATLGDLDSQMDKALLLSTVSSRWLQHIASMHSLWTNIFISHDTQDVSARVATCLALSGERKISVVIHAPNWDSYIDMLIPHTDRIESMRLEYINEPGKVIESLGYLPALTSIELPDSFHLLLDADERTLQLMDNAPSLTSLGDLSLTRRILYHPRAAKLTSLRTQVPFHEVVRILSTNMKPLQLSFSYLGLEIPLENEEAVDIEYDPRGLINFDALKLVWSHSTYGKLFSHCISSVRRLYIGTSTGNALGELLFALRSSQVEEIQLDLLEEAGPLPPRSDYAILSSLYRLKIFFSQPSIDSLMEIMPIIMPSLAYLDSGSYTLDKGIRFLGQLRHLRELEMVLGSDMPEPKEPIYFKNLENLTLSIDTPFDLSFMQTRKLGHIRTIAYVYPNDKIFPASYLIPASSFGTLTSIHIPVHLPAHFRLASLPLLQTLQIHWNAESVWGCDLLEQIILTPRICPRLRSISIGSMPVEWDLVLLMLLRRNFLHDKSVSRIQAIRSHLQLPIPLAWLISNLLRCKLIQGLELEKFSIEKVGELLFRIPSK